MTKAHDRRVKQSLEQARLNMKAEKLELEKLRREQGRERAEAVMALRILCGQYGDNDWSDDAPLRDILEMHLAEPLGEMVAAITARLERVQRAAERFVVERPAPSRLAVVQAPGRTDTSQFDVRRVPGGRGPRWQGTCMCGWRSQIHESERAAFLETENHYNHHPAWGSR